MTINVERDCELITLEITGRLDTTTAPKLEAVIFGLSKDIKELVFNMSGVDYFSSAVANVFIKAEEKMAQNQGIMRIEKPSDTVYEAFQTADLLKMVRNA